MGEGKNNLDFDELRVYRNETRAWLQMHVRTLAFYRTEKPGYVHLFEETRMGGAGRVKKDPSRASTATCVESLIARDENLAESAGDPAQLLASMIGDVDGGSAGLPEMNAFTTAFMLDAALQVSSAAKIPLSDDQEKLKNSAVERLNAVLLHDQADGLLPTKFGGPSDKDSKPPASRAEKGSANIEPYPPTAYLTQLVVRTLKRAEALHESAQAAVRAWSRVHMEREIALLVSTEYLADAYALAYAAITFASLVDESRLTPQEKRILSVAVDRVFAAQNPDGSWPRSRPLFHYQEVGNAYCFEYEMLTQLLGCSVLSDDVERHIDGLLKAVAHLNETRYDLSELGNRKGAAWASGHHPQIRGPESWSTASVYHFLHLMERFLSRMLRQQLFLNLKADSHPLSKTTLDDFAKNMLDSEMQLTDGKSVSFKEQVKNKFLKPLHENRKRVANGKQFVDANGEKIEMSMLMFGPPGTSKTSLAEQIAAVMGWPLLKVDPSHILVDGWDRVHATAIQLLDALAELDEVVVLLDEFDELVRTRGSEGEEPISRFFTTAMLPKLIKLNDERRIILLMATNYVENFDAAITREGRFDKVVQVMPPSAAAKLDKWPVLKSNFTATRDLSMIEDLSFGEVRKLAKDLEHIKTTEDAIPLLANLHKVCNLSQPAKAEGGETWKTICEKQREKVRI